MLPGTMKLLFRESLSLSRYRVFTALFQRTSYCGTFQLTVKHPRNPSLFPLSHPDYYIYIYHHRRCQNCQGFNFSPFHAIVEDISRAIHIYRIQNRCNYSCRLDDARTGFAFTDDSTSSGNLHFKFDPLTYLRAALCEPQLKIFSSSLHEFSLFLFFFLFSSSSFAQINNPLTHDEKQKTKE